MKYPNHIQYIIDNYSTQLLARLKGEGRNLTVEGAMDTLMACDPSQGKKLTDWLVKAYCSGGFLWEDVEIGGASKLAEVLDMYQIYFHQIPRDQRNIYAYKSYGELYTLLKNYLIENVIEETPGSQEIRRRERAQALEESEVLYRSEEMIVAVPLTQFAAVWWGRGTKWCTSAEKHNYFDQYNTNAPLIVITLLNQNSGSQISQGLSGRGITEKFQLWTDGDTIQFMDATDSSVRFETVQENWAKLKPIILWLIEQNGLGIQYLPDSFKTQEICEKAVEQNALAINCVPSDYKNAELYRKAVLSSWVVFGDIPHEERTAELCRLAVKQNAYALDSVPNKFKTDELFKLALEQNGEALSYIPLGKRTLEFCKLAVEQSGYALYNVPEHLKTYNLCLAAIKTNGKALNYTPRMIQSTEMYWKAIEQDGKALEHVPVEMRTLELCKRAIQQHAYAIGFLPKEFRTDELYKQAVEKDGTSVYYIPDNYITNELLRLAVKQTPRATAHIKRKFLTNDIIKLAVTLWGKTDDIPPQFLNLEIMELAKKFDAENKCVEWDKSILFNLRITLDQYFKEQTNETSQPYPIHNR